MRELRIQKLISKHLSLYSSPKFTTGYVKLLGKTPIVFQTDQENSTNSGDKHCIPTHFYKELDVSYKSQHAFSKVTVTIFENYPCIRLARGKFELANQH